MHGRLPDFMVIGAQKSGTTWLSHWLSSSPDVYMPTNGELMFFDKKENYFELGLRRYLECFSAADKNQRVGERTANYLWVSGAFPEWGAPDRFRQSMPERIHHALGDDMQFIAVLRNPIDRAMSGFLHHLRRKRVGLNATLRSEWLKWGIAHMGLYSVHLDRWLDAYPRENFFIMTYEGLFSGQGDLNRLAKFLGIRVPEETVTHRDVLHEGIGFTRCESGVYGSGGTKFADENDIGCLRWLFSDDVARLSRDWAVDVSPWRDDFPLG